jgi:manganese efflux pump family protein
VSLTDILLLALALSADAFSVALVVGLRFSSARQVFRLSWHFGLFQALMPFLGAVGGTALKKVVGDVDHYVAFALLAAIGLHMLWESRRGEARLRDARDPTRGLSLVGLSVATSIDAFGAGIGLALSGAPLLSSCATIGVTCGLCTLAGMHLASRAGPLLGRFAGTLGGLVLLALAVKMLGI